MKTHFRQVTESDMGKFPVWYEGIGGSKLFSHFMPYSFVSFEQSKDLLWFIVMNGDDEIGAIWFEKINGNEMSYSMGIYLNRMELFGKGIGKMVIKSAIDGIARKKGIQEIYLNVRQNNARAIRCYESLGFETVYEGEKKTVSDTIEFKRMKLHVNACNKA